MVRLACICASVRTVLDPMQARANLKIVSGGEPCAGPGAGRCANCGARALSVCAQVSDAGLSRMEALSEEVELRPGEILAREGDAAAHVFNITGGAVRVYKLMADGRRQIIGFLFAGDFLGLTSDKDYAFSAEALEPVTACRFNRKGYMGVVEQFPELESALLSRFTSDLSAAQAHMLLLGRKTARERVASFLRDLSARAARRGADADSVHLVMTRGEIADYLGLTLETVSRTLSALKSKGAIRQTDSRTYTILARRQLEAMSGA